MGDGQLKLDFSGSIPPFSDCDTSLKAAVSKIGTAESDRRRVYKFICDQGSYGATDDEINNAIGGSSSSTRPRRWELAGNGKMPDGSDRIAVIRKSGEKRRTRTGNPAAVWVVLGEATPPASEGEGE